MSPNIILDAFAKQSEWCEKLGSPFMAQLMGVLTEVLDETTGTGQKIFAWQGELDALSDAVPIRLAGGLHALVRRGDAPDLAAFYPPNPTPERSKLSKCIETTIGLADDMLVKWLDHPPQTNEVARSAILYLGMRWIAARYGLPLSIFEIGSSAGLNLNLDLYRYRFGDEAVGDPDSVVTISPSWNHSWVPGEPPTILSRLGCDKSPIDFDDPEQRERLMAYVWPDQFERLDRLEKAIDMARQRRPVVEKASAGAWLDRIHMKHHEEGTARVVFHSIMFQYLSDPEKVHIAAAMDEAGRRATIKKPLVWLRFEQEGHRGTLLSAQVWPGGETFELAQSDGHVRKIKWLL